jgi:hypothetical protein
MIAPTAGTISSVRSIPAVRFGALASVVALG